MKNYILLVLITSITYGLPSNAQVKINQTKKSIDYSRLSRIDTVMQSYVDNEQLSGLVTLVSKEGSIVQLGKYGHTTLDKKQAVNEKSIFRIASMTKPITSVAIMSLYEQGKLKLTDPIDKYIPAFKNLQCRQPDGSDSPCKQRLRIIHLLSHTSGITYVQSENEISMLYKENGIIDGVVKSNTGLEQLGKLGNIPLKFEPGTQWEYGLSTDLLGYLVEVISGKDLETFLREEIFDPLDMGDTYFSLPNEKVTRLIPLHSLNDEGELVRLYDNKEYTISGLSVQPNYPFEIKNKYTSGGGGLVSTILDYHNFLSMILNKGSFNGNKVLSPKSIELMQQNHIGDMPFFLNGYRFGLGFAVMTNLAETRSLGSEGDLYWGGIFYTRFWVDPKEKIIGITMAQQFPFSHLDTFRKFKTMTYQALND